MKLFTMLLLSLFFGKSCTQETKKEIKNTQISYVANNRGFHQRIVIKNQEISVNTDRNDESLGKTSKISDADWGKLVALFSKIDLEKLNTYEGPTQKRFHDGAAMADLVINYKEKEYTSTTFDHGTPPVEIAEFVNKIVLLAKNKK